MGSPQEMREVGQENTDEIMVEKKKNLSNLIGKTNPQIQVQHFPNKTNMRKNTAGCSTTTKWLKTSNEGKKAMFYKDDRFSIRNRASRQKRNIFKVRKVLTWEFIPSKVSFTNEGKLKTLSDIQMLEEFIPSGPILK